MTTTQNNYAERKQLFQQRITDAKAINIAHFLHDKYNYRIKKDGREFLVYTDTNAGKINVFRDRSNNNLWLYKSWGTGEAGNILHFIGRHIFHEDLKQAAAINKILDLLNNYAPSEIVRYNFPVKDKIPGGKADLAFLPNQSRNYLHSRGIDDSIIDHPKYKEAIFNKQFFPDPEKPFSFLNTAFPVKDFEGRIVDFSMKNRKYTTSGSYETFSSYVSGGNKSQGLWTSETDEELVGNIHTFIIAESELDALSYTKLNPALLKNTLDISFGGHISELQFKIIEKHYFKFEPKEIFLISDNDSNGAKYNASLFDFLNDLSKGSECRISIDTPANEKDWNDELMSSLGMLKENIRANSNNVQNEISHRIWRNKI